jgi:subtilase family serine protease
MRFRQVMAAMRPVNGLLIAWSQGVAANVGNIYEFGGSSAASPQWAAIIALADQTGHRRLGVRLRLP